MYIKHPVRRAIAAAVLASSAGLAVGAVGAVRAASNDAADSRSITVAPAAAVESPPGSVEAKFANSVIAQVIDHYEVADGDSFWAIAERQLPERASAGTVMALTKALIAHNAARLGHDDPAMVQPGDVVDIVPAPSAPVSAANAPQAPAAVGVSPARHEVVAGDSYWAIAESSLGGEATPAAVLEKTEDLIELNSARLGYEDPRMLQPGDVVYLGNPASTPHVADDHDTDTTVTGASDPASATMAPEAASPKRTSPFWTTLWTRPVDHRGASHRQTPTSPPLSEIAIINREATNPLERVTSRIEPHRTPTRTADDDLGRGHAPPSAQRPVAARLGRARAS